MVPQRNGPEVELDVLTADGGGKNVDSPFLTRFNFTDALCAQGDEKKPACSKCCSRGEKCEWDTGVTFRFSNLGAGHPSMRQSRAGKLESCNQLPVGRPSQFKKLQLCCRYGLLENFAYQVIRLLIQHPLLQISSRGSGRSRKVI